MLMVLGLISFSYSETSCDYANRKTNFEYKNICSVLDSNAYLEKQWRVAMDSKSKKVTSGSLMIGAGIGLGFASITIATNAIKDCDPNLFGNSKNCGDPTPGLLVGIPATLLFWSGVFTLLFSESEISKAKNMTQSYYLSLK